MWLYYGRWCLVHSPHSKARKVGETLSRVSLSKCKKLHSILYSHWGPKTDRSDSRPIETNWTSILECCSSLGPWWCILGHGSFRWAYVCVVPFLCVLVYVDSMSDTGLGNKDKLLLLIHTSLNSSLLFTGTRVRPSLLLLLHGMIHAFVLYCLPGDRHNSHSLSACMWEHGFLQVRWCEGIAINPCH